MKIEMPLTITIDDKSYPVSDFSDSVKKILMIHTEWRNQLQTEKLSVTKTEAALKMIDFELTQAVRSELGKPAPTADSKLELSNESPAPVAKKKRKKS